MYHLLQKAEWTAVASPPICIVSFSPRSSTQDWDSSRPPMKPPKPLSCYLHHPIRTSMPMVIPSILPPSPLSLPLSLTPPLTEAFGKILIKTIYDGRVVPLRFPPSMYKFLLGNGHYTLSDLETYDSYSATSLRNILTHPGADALGLDFDEFCSPCFVRYFSFFFLFFVSPSNAYPICLITGTGRKADGCKQRAICHVKDQANLRKQKDFAAHCHKARHVSGYL
mgnify:CR=1 FL=1